MKKMVLITRDFDVFLELFKSYISAEFECDIIEKRGGNSITINTSDGSEIIITILAENEDNNLFVSKSVKIEVKNMSLKKSKLLRNAIYHIIYRIL